MGKVISGISMSLDGFVTGPNVSREQQLGDGGDVLQQLAYGIPTRATPSCWQGWRRMWARS